MKQKQTFSRAFLSRVFPRFACKLDLLIKRNAKRVNWLLELLFEAIHDVATRKIQIRNSSTNLLLKKEISLLTIYCDHHFTKTKIKKK